MCCLWNRFIMHCLCTVRCLFSLPNCFVLPYSNLLLYVFNVLFLCLDVFTKHTRELWSTSHENVQMRRMCIEIAGHRPQHRSWLSGQNSIEEVGNCLSMGDLLTWSGAGPLQWWILHAGVPLTAALKERGLFWGQFVWLRRQSLWMCGGALNF